MEVVGVVAAIPGLIQIVQAVTTAICGLSKRKVAAKIVEQLAVQLRDLEDILQDVKKRWRQRNSDQHRLQRLSPALTQLQTELLSLKEILQTSKPANGPSRYIKRALFLSTSLEKTLKESVSRLSQVKASLTLLIAHHQDEVTEEILKLSLSELRLKLRALLRPSSDSFIPDKTDGTCEWIWSHQTFRNWVDGPITPKDHSSRTLGLYGIKGCGKSVLVKSVAERLRDRGDICLHFSFWTGNEAQRKFVDLLQTASWQILNHVPDKGLEQLSKPWIMDPSINERGLLRIIHNALPLVGSKVYCFIDGIGESTEDWNSQSNGCLSAVLDLVKSHDNLRLLLAGREPSLRTFLKEACPRLEITENLIREDIHRLVAAELNESLTIHTPAIKDMVQESLEAKTQVMFLWATLVFKELRRCFSVEEVKQTLKQVPYDLDREYHRLFLQLMTRTRGTLTNPSPSMKRARCLISSLLACPEPMTAEDLCYSYAAQVNSSGTIEDDLITVDGIMDACGDFVRVTEGRYHLIHASAADFLTRPESDWGEEDSKILYFRVDVSNAQASMCSACFTYIKSLDLGYPLTDDGVSSLPSRYPFFSYVTKFLPVHLVQVVERGGQQHPEAYQFVKTPQFCALIEYAFATIQSSVQNNNADSIYYWIEFFSMDSGGQDAELDQIYNVELQRQLQCFGTHDERYQSWQSLAIFISAYSFEHATPGPVTTSPRKNNLPPMIKEAVFSNLPPHLKRTHGLSIKQLPHNLHTVSQILSGFGKMTTNLLASFTESLSAPMILLATLIADCRGDRPLTQRLASFSVRKTKGRGDFYEICSLLELAGTKYKHTDYNINEIENLSQEAVRIANNLPVQPHIQYLKVLAYHWLLVVLIEQNKTEEAREVTRFFEKLIGENREKCSSYLWEYGLCHTQRGAVLRMNILRVVAQKYSQRGYFEDAEKLSAQAMAVFEQSRFKPNSEGLALNRYRSIMLFNARRFDECLASTRKLWRLLETLEGTCSRPQDIHARWQTQFILGCCLAIKGDMREAEKWWCKAADEVKLLGLDETHLGWPYLHWLVSILARVGQYDQSESIARKLLDIKGVTKSDDKKDIVFHSLGSLVCKLKENGYIDTDYKAFLHCHSLLMAVSELQDEAAEATWWEEWASDIMHSIVVPFRTHTTLPYLKSIDTYLHLNNRSQRAFSGYRTLGNFYFEQGDIEAAEIVSSDAASRAFADLSYRISTGYVMASDTCFYTGKLSRRKILLCVAYEQTMIGNFYFCEHFATEMFYASEYMGDIERLEENLERDMRLSFMTQACEHLARAMKANDKIPQEVALDTNQSDDEDNTEEGRQARVSDLQTRLEHLGAGSMLDEAMARLDMEETKARKLRRAESQEFCKAMAVPRRRASIAFDQGAFDMALEDRSRRLIYVY
ncbi:Tetratricopeptide-like helical [Fusarium albosuccineum]|uniref:Tetratricopeptide-like helical n=1 Tax=Fusarium albosuccineum TaxID=1237068 RepID=A0A8H4P8E5_9HYPO|nr:Tetratricopeptide-like helical [Fusarium albosuccineum]